MEENRIKSDFMLTLGKPHRHIAGESHRHKTEITSDKWMTHFPPKLDRLWNKPPNQTT